ncbi:MAG: hypothetical protein RL219_449, partial [Actinomycetota bacterium]
HMTAFSTGSCSVLIVEDQPIIAWDLSEQLTSLGYVVQAIADNGDDAVQFALELRPSLIYMDISLRGREDGIRVAQRIQEHVDVPVVFLTAHADAATAERSLRANPYGYLTKPFDKREILTSASIAVNRHRSAQRARFLEVAFEDAQVGVVVLDAHTHQVVFKNRPFCLLFGLPVDIQPGETLSLRTSLSSHFRAGPLLRRSGRRSSRHRACRVARASGRGQPGAVHRTLTLRALHGTLFLAPKCLGPSNDSRIAAVKVT